MASAGAVQRLTVYAALLALPGGHSSLPATAGSGIVEIANGVRYGDHNGRRFLVLGGTDHNYASPPTGLVASQRGNHDCVRRSEKLRAAWLQRKLQSTCG